MFGIINRSNHLGMRPVRSETVTDPPENSANQDEDDKTTSTHEGENYSQHHNDDVVEIDWESRRFKINVLTQLFSTVSQ